MKKIILFILLMALKLSGAAQEIKDLNRNGSLSLRGLSVVNDQVVWVSGSQGKVGRSTDAGKTWEWISVKGYENCEFRDIEAFSENVAVIMAVAEPAYILRTSNGGKSWKKVYENKDKGMFLDAMDFFDTKNGVVVGDPISSRFFIARTTDGGKSWQKDYALTFPVFDGKEACFASSGTNVRMLDAHEYTVVTGGMETSILKGDKKIALPLLNGKTSTGANSIAAKDSLHFIVVGGDFTEADTTHGNCAITLDGGQTWLVPKVPPHGYRSCVEYISGDTWVCCGLNGVDISTDNGKTWTLISKESYHACRKAKKGSAVFFSGNNSRIGVWSN